MSLVQVVTAIVEADGEATIDTIQAQLPAYMPGKKVTRDQVISALCNARVRGYIQVLRHGARVWRGSEPSTYGPKGETPVMVRTVAAPIIGPRPVSSVWELGDRARANEFDRRSRALSNQ